MLALARCHAPVFLLRGGMKLSLVTAGMAILILACAGGADRTSGPDGGRAATGTPGATEEPEDIPSVVGWNTDWSKRSIALSELILGIGASDPRDVIPPLDEPKFETVQ